MRIFLPLVAVLAVGCAGLPRPGLPASASHVWRLSERDGGSASACPVVAFEDDTYLFLTAQHVTRGWGEVPAGTTLVGWKRTRTLKVIGYANHARADITVLTVQGDRTPLPLIPVSTAVHQPGELIYTVGYPGPTKDWFGYSGYLATKDGTSSHIERGMSGGALLNSSGDLVGILVAHAGHWKPFIVVGPMGGYIGNLRLDHHFPEQSYVVHLSPLKSWLREQLVIE
ncbi:hypothetical protein LCGC14_1468660 [marine sediment metagenome]|uniref:Peptidase S1 domain-containing protein n=1 Tax=marine sediment metagenome TaxID=412755 RepID=A0A0F9JYX1_9ZZZZ